MTRADLASILEIEQTSFPSPWSRRMLEDELELDHSIPLTLEVEGEVAGYIFARRIADELHIVNLAVSPTVRRKGYGRHLLEFMLKKGRELGSKLIYLEVRTSNLAAIRLYEKLGFSIIRLRSRYYEDGSDAYEMGLIIREPEESR